MDDELFGAYTLKLTNYLGHKGFDVVEVRSDEKNPHYKVFMFVNTPELQDAVSEFRKNKNTRR